MIQSRPLALIALLLASSPVPVLAQALPEAPPAGGSQPAPLLLPPALPPTPAPLPPPEDDMSLARKAATSGDHAEALARFLRVLAARPRDLEALTGAGRAALLIRDSNGALNFYARAEEIAPANGRVKAGLGMTMNQLLQPRHALRFFNEAVQLGVPPQEIAIERGLAFDLRGDNRRARLDYEMALRFTPGDPEATRRLAASLAMGGDTPGALATLDQLLRRHDNAAWRMRAFILAISGDLRGAQDTAASVLARRQVDALVPFLQKLGRLKPAQQAAAIHLGVMPSDGRSYSEAEIIAANNGTAEPVLSRSNLKRAAERIERERAERAVREQAEQAERERAERAERERAALVAAQSDELGDGVDVPEQPPRLARVEPPATPRMTPAPRPSVATATPPAVAVPPSAGKTTTLAQLQPSDLRARAERLRDVLKPVEEAKPKDEPKPKEEAKPKEPVKGKDATAAKDAKDPAKAKDIATAKDAKDAKSKDAAKAKDAKDTATAKDAKNGKDAKAKDAREKADAKDPKAKASKSREPERHWVQVATGAYKPDLGKEWARLKGKHGALLGRWTPWTTPLNRTNRLMIGPFKTADEAQAFVNKAAGAGFMTSPVKTAAGQAVERVSN